ncbi:MAG: copper amine oxidase N-terminal domain-containing protein [Epulopiscium sp.]|nr:copper amine oxidase N-terminal domain-containing protein [Candidatus Epulonipiscium sp.]
MIKLKKFVAIGLALMCSMSTVTAKGMDLNLVINGSTVVPTVKPYVDKGRTMVPLRVISESLGAEVSYNQNTKRITITKGSKKIEMTLGEYQVKIDGITEVMDTKPVVKNNTTMVPLRFISEALNCDVVYDSKKYTVIVTGDISSSGGGSGGSIYIPDAPVITDAWGRKSRTTNLPKNAKHFPYIAEGVPNWCYEQQPWNDNFFGTWVVDNGVKNAKQVSAFPLTAMGNETSDIRRAMFTCYPLLDEFIDAQLNFDYRTVDEEKFVDVMRRSINKYSMKLRTEQAVEDLARGYIEYAKTYKVSSKVEYQILPETAWISADADLSSFKVSVWMKLTPLTVPSESSNKVWDDFGSMSIQKDGTPLETSALEAGKTYEGIVTYTFMYNDDIKGYQLHYNGTEALCQINPKKDLLNGVAPSMKDPNRQEKFCYGWMKEGLLLSRYEQKDLWKYEDFDK